MKTPSRSVAEKKEMLAMHIDGKSLRAIGRKFDITGERARQILSRFPEYDRAAYKKNYSPLLDLTCLNPKCGKIYQRKRYRITSLYCSRDCSAQHRTDLYNSMTVRTCSKCGIEKPITEYFWGGRKQERADKRWRMGRCKVCHGIAVLKWVAGHREQAAAMNRKAQAKYQLKMKKLHGTQTAS